jgi:hypothetical protein
LTNVSIWQKAGLKKTVAMKLLEPLSIIHIALATGNILGMARIDKVNLNVITQEAP